MSGFYKHLTEAIAINKERKKLYAELSDGRTKFLSNFLVSTEYSTLPFALFYDQQAKSFNEQGIMVVADDFVPMDINAFDHDVEHRSQYSEVLLKMIAKGNKDLCKGLPSKFAEVGQLQESFDKTLDWYKVVSELEKENTVHFAMTKHVLESVAFIAKNGIDYAKQSENETLKVSGSMINIHKIAIRGALTIDKMANPFQMENIGIIVNDMPEIPIH